MVYGLSDEEMEVDVGPGNEASSGARLNLRGHGEEFLRHRHPRRRLPRH